MHASVGYHVKRFDIYIGHILTLDAVELIVFSTPIPCSLSRRGFFLADVVFGIEVLPNSGFAISVPSRQNACVVLPVLRRVRARPALVLVCAARLAFRKGGGPPIGEAFDPLAYTKRYRN